MQVAQIEKESFVIVIIHAIVVVDDPDRAISHHSQTLHLLNNRTICRLSQITVNILDNCLASDFQL